ncbi:ATP-dependent RNA helicase vasa-like [Choristoneura fumiferana]|uniref:ATP-dependent RNA helicase vasa-like n=1 Tax=Choristoneura fumiferana TaxID=7141 RepID=UPI003D15E104
MSRYELSSRFCGDMGAALATVPEEISPNKCEDVEQVFKQVSKYEKMKALTKLLDENDGKRVVVFAKTNRNADFIAVMLSEQRKLTTSIHGERLRRDKQLARKSFISGHHHILVATSAAVCGPDIKDVDIVVNYDLPTSVEEYVHRIVRTGRVGHRGKAVSFFDIDHDAGLVDDLTRVLRQANQPLPDFFPVESAATCQISDAMAVTSELSTADQVQCPAAPA